MDGEDKRLPLNLILEAERRVEYQKTNPERKLRAVVREILKQEFPYVIRQAFEASVEDPWTELVGKAQRRAFWVTQAAIRHYSENLQRLQAQMTGTRDDGRRKKLAREARLLETVLAPQSRLYDAEDRANALAYEVLRDNFPKVRMRGILNRRVVFESGNNIEEALALEINLRISMAAAGKTDMREVKKGVRSIYREVLAFAKSITLKNSHRYRENEKTVDVLERISETAPIPACVSAEHTRKWIKTFRKTGILGPVREGAQRKSGQVKATKTA